VVDDLLVARNPDPDSSLTRPLAQEWAYRWLGACLAELDAAAGTADMEATFASGGPVPAAAPRPAEVREWARAHGLPVNDRGRISADVVRQYLAAATDRCTSVRR
jgi:hypothetical protein